MAYWRTSASSNTDTTEKRKIHTKIRDICVAGKTGSQYNAPPSTGGLWAMHNFPIYRVAFYQSLIWLIMLLIAIATLGKVGAYSVALGGLISLLPGIYFMFRYFLVSGARAMEQVVRNAYIAEAIKLGLMGLGFMAVFKLVNPLSPAGVFGGFLVMHIAGLVITASKVNDKRK